MASSDTSVPDTSNQMLRRGAIILGVLFGLLAAGYYMMLRLDYSVLFNDLKPVDASAVIEELDEQGIGYRLSDGGRTIEVVSNQVDAVRLSIIGADVSSKGLVGFELFNESEMGLTDFAQKIKYQRALQGELARSIMMMDGIEAARVHIAIPERAMFRGSDTKPTAAITIVTEIGTQLDKDRIDGVKRLIAASVPELSASDVVILDEQGQIVDLRMPDIGTPSGASTGPETQRDQQESYYQRKGDEILAALFGADRPDLILSLKPVASAERVSPNEDVLGSAEASLSPQFRVALISNETLAEPIRERIYDAIVTVLPANTLSASDISFLDRSTIVEVEQVETAPAIGPAVSSAESQFTPFEYLMRLDEARLVWAGAGGLLFLGLVFLLVRRSRRPSLSADEHRDFADLLKSELNPAMKSAL